MIDVARESLLTVADVARKLRVTTKAVYDWINSKKLESVRIGGRVRTSENALQRFARQSNDSHPLAQAIGSLSPEDVARELREKHGIDIEAGSQKASRKKRQMPDV